jgi:6-phosphogluconolactonase
MAVLTVLPDEGALAERAVERFVTVVEESIRARGHAIVCLTGGNTPRAMYERLASESWQQRVEWDRVRLYWGDERHVPPDDRESNYKMARDTLVMHVPIPAAHVHRIRGELPAEEAAALYERALPDHFDLMLLGVGEDAHIASIFPGSPVLAERTRGVAAVWAPHLKAYRITLTPPALLDSHHIVLLVAGEKKADAVAAAFEKPTDARRYPVHLLREAEERVEWFIDRAAARALSSPPE